MATPKTPGSAGALDDQNLTQLGFRGEIGVVVQNILDINSELDFSDLDAASTPLSDTDLLRVRQGTTNKKVQISTIRSELATDAQIAQAAAEAAQTAAESARDAAQLSSGVYADTAAGLAATSVGDYFSVPSADADEYLILYRHDSGPTATEISRYPSASALGNIYFNASQSGIKNTITYETTEGLTKSSGLALSAGSYSSGEKALEVNATGTTLKYLDSSVDIPSSVSRDFLVQIKVEILSVTDSGNTYGIGIGTGESPNRNAVTVFANSTIYQEGDTVAAGSVATDVPPSAYTTGSIFSVWFLKRNTGDIYLAITDDNNRSTGWLALSGFASSGRLWIAFRRPSNVALTTTIYNDSSQYQDARLLTASIKGNSAEAFVPLAIDNAVVSPQLYQVGNSLFITPQTELDNGYSAYLLNASISSGYSAAEAFGTTHPLVEGKALLLKAKCGSTSSTPAIGLSFGDSSTECLGLAFRSNGTRFYLELPSGSTSGAPTGPSTSPSFAQDDWVFIEARLAGGSLGDHVVEYYMYTQETQKFGPYTITGVPSVTNAWIALRGDSSWTDLQLLEKEATPAGSVLIQKPSLVYVSPTGDDSNTGTSPSYPFATFSKAVTSVSDNGIIELAGGEYRQTLNLTSVDGNVWVRAAADSRAIILGSNQLSLTKTPGYTQVYQATLSSKPTGMGGNRGPAMIFEHGTYTNAITSNDRHDLQRGEEYRLPYAEMLEAASLADLDTAGGQGKWFWDAGTIYLAATDGSDATLKRYEVRARDCVLAEGRGSVKLTRVDAYYSDNNGMQFRGSLSVHRENCRSLGNYRNGFSDDCNVIYSVRDEAGGNGNDGFNGTAQNYSGTGNWDVVDSGTYHDPWSHDNYDDGISYHARGECTVYGGLMEYNNKAGVVHVAGASCVCYNTISRYASYGFYASTAPPDDRTNSTLRCHGVVSYGNDYNFATIGVAVLLAFDSTSGAVNTYGYYQADTAVLIARNCRHGGDAAKAKNGTISVVNDSALT